MTSGLNQLCKWYDDRAAEFGLAPRPPSLVFKTEDELVTHFDAEMAKKGFIRPLPLMNFEIILPIGRAITYFVPQHARPGKELVRPTGYEDASGIDHRTQPARYHVWLRESSPRFRSEDRVMGERYGKGWRRYFKTDREAQKFLHERERPFR